jgi:hypothetical protein
MIRGRLLYDILVTYMYILYFCFLILATVPSPEGYDVKFNVVEKIRGGSIFSETSGNDIHLVRIHDMCKVFRFAHFILQCKIYRET